MWSSIENVGKGFVDALDKTGDAISKAATNANGSNANRQRAVAPAAGASAETPTEETVSGNEKTQDTQQLQTKANPLLRVSQLGKGFSTVVQKAQQAAQNSIQTVENTARQSIQRAQQTAQTSMQTVQNTAQQSYQMAQNAVEKEQQRLETLMGQKSGKKHWYRRKAQLPLDVKALQDAQVVYVTDRLISMSHPAMPSTTNADITGERKLAAIGQMLDKRHPGQYMVWNISEVEDYDYNILDGQVLAFSFPGSPSPPLGLLLKLLMSMESWLKASPTNVAVVHCLTGKGRTSMVLAAFLCWMGEAGFRDMNEALEYIAQCKQFQQQQDAIQQLTIPSQRRYALYFMNMLDGVRPSQPPLKLQRIIMSEAPRFAKGPMRKNKKEGETETPEELHARMGCTPYIQIFKGGQLIFTAGANISYQDKDIERQGVVEDDKTGNNKNKGIPFCQVSDGTVIFAVNRIVQGDVLIRARHYSAKKKQKISMFRAAFHTGYVPPNVLRLTKDQLDGACQDDKHFSPEFFVYLIFEPVNAEEASALLKQQELLQLAQQEQEQAERLMHGNAAVEASTTITASAYDSMLHRDSRFWDVIRERKKAQAEQDQKAEQTPPPEDSDAKKWDDSRGPTVGRRRVFASKHGDDDSKDDDEHHDSDSSDTAKNKKSNTVLDTFSIGGEMDFLPETKPKPKKAPSTERDSLMEALIAVEDEEQGTEEIVFEESTPVPSAVSPTMANLPPIPNNGLTESSPGFPEHQESGVTASTTESMNQLKNLLGDDVDLNLDAEVNALLDGGDDELEINFEDDDDAELQDLENFLTSK